MHSFLLNERTEWFLSTFSVTDNVLDSGLKQDLSFFSLPNLSSLPHMHISKWNHNVLSFQVKSLGVILETPFSSPSPTPPAISWRCLRSICSVGPPFCSPFCPHPPSYISWTSSIAFQPVCLLPCYSLSPTPTTTSNPHLPTLELRRGRRISFGGLFKL